MNKGNFWIKDMPGTSSLQVFSLSSQTRALWRNEDFKGPFTSGNFWQKTLPKIFNNCYTMDM